MDNGVHKIKLKGKEYQVQLPGFAEREDIVIGYQAEEENSRRQQRVLFAALGLCVPELGGGLAAFESVDLDVVKFGGRVYSALMGQGHSRDELATAAVGCFEVTCKSLFPREDEVSKAENFTGGAEVAPI